METKKFYYILIFALTFFSCATFGDGVKKQMIKESTSRYSGSCPCPYFVDRAGRKCGGRSAWSRPGGASPLCYESDITDEMVKAYKKSKRVNR